MSYLKTQPNSNSVQKYINDSPNPKTKNDFQVVLNEMKNVCDEEPVMWGPSIVGFGRYKMAYKSGKTTEWMLL